MAATQGGGGVSIIRVGVMRLRHEPYLIYHREISSLLNIKFTRVPGQIESECLSELFEFRVTSFKH